MQPEHLETFAHVVAAFCQEAQPGDRILVEGSPATLPAVRAVTAALEARGAVVDACELGHAWRDLDRVRSLTGYVTLRTTAERSPPGDRTVPPEAQRLKTTLRKTTTVLPDALLAARAGMTLADLETYFAGLLHLDDPDPIAGFHALRDEQESLLGRLRAARTVRIESDDTDLTLLTSGRGWINSYGRRNIPSGEMYTSPVETSANGWMVFDVPNYAFGEKVSGVRLEFRDGTLVHAGAREGERALEVAIATDVGAKRLGELGIGGNRRMDRLLGSTLFDEKVAGTVHLALGRSYPQTGGRNESALHWDLVKDLRPGGRLTLDGVPFLEDGRFVGV